MSNTPNQTPELPDENPKRVQLTQTAASLITGQRQEDYGPPVKNFQRIANLWNGHMETDIFTPRKVAELMLLLKMARTINSPTEDSYVDAIGYAAIAGELAGIEIDAEKKAEEAYEYLAQDKQDGNREARRAFNIASNETLASFDEWRRQNGFLEGEK
jgi:hypothetical protein